MSLKRRNTIALVLILLAALLWTLGRELLTPNSPGIAIDVTHPTEYSETTNAIANTSISYRETEYAGDGSVPTTRPTGETDTSAPAPDPETHRPRRVFGYFLTVLAILSGAVAVFVFSQKAPFVGPDVLFLLAGLSNALYWALEVMRYPLVNYIFNSFSTPMMFLGVLLTLLAVRELWGWLTARLPLSWCQVYRVSRRSTRSQIALLFPALWIVLSAVLLIQVLIRRGAAYPLFPSFCYAACAFLGAAQLWRYGSDLDHFKNQLEHFRQGQPIAVGKGAFSQTEAQLLEVQTRHEEAIRTAVTSERFKVELISNVSHDLRTPLTSILGYSELLQNQPLTPEGQEHLRRLHQKAGYMNDLVESLFELTKVSSGVVETKREEIDLIRLLEQTLGLFDDQLTQASLTVRRSYCAQAIPILTDGARMHQVFANLLGNAIKYALSGTRIYLEVKETDSHILVRMMNTACYEMDFKPEEILQRFARGDKARSTKGSGLGLAIAQTYTQSVGGDFQVGIDGDQFSAIVELPKPDRNL